jgi:hypothetical protein
MRAMTRISVMFAMLSAVAACASDDGGSGSNLTSTEQVNNSCPSDPAILTGTVAVGGSCTAAEDCAPTCCSCQDGSQYLAVNCVDGKCAGASDACPNTADACE